MFNYYNQIIVVCVTNRLTSLVLNVGLILGVMYLSRSDITVVIWSNTVPFTRKCLNVMHAALNAVFRDSNKATFCEEYIFIANCIKYLSSNGISVGLAIFAGFTVVITTLIDTQTMLRTDNCSYSPQLCTDSKLVIDCL